MKIADYLMTGEGNEIATRILKEQTGLSSRDIRNAVHVERMKGVAILSNYKGYFLAKDDAEKVRFAASMQRRAREINKAAAAVMRGA